MVDVIIKDGNIVYAVDSHRAASLGNRLRSQGRLTLEQLQDCLEQGKRKKQALGKVVVDRGYVSLAQLEPWVRRQVEEIVYSLFGWDSGDFEFQDVSPDLSGLVTTHLDIPGVILEASRRIEPTASPGAPPAGSQENNFSAIITGYTNILQIIWQNLEPELGQETSRLVEGCIPGARPGQNDLFKNFHPKNPLPTIVSTIEANLEAFTNLKNKRVFLVESFNRFLLNILNRVPGILGKLSTQNLLEEIENALPYIASYLKDLNVTGDIVKDLKKIMTNVEGQISKKRKK